MSNNSDKLFSEFDPVSIENWKKQAEKEIQKTGGDPEKLLSPDSEYHVKPYYSESERDELNFPERKGAGSLIMERIVVKDESDSNETLLKRLNTGVNGIRFKLYREVDLQILLKDFLLDAVDLQWELSEDAVNRAVQLQTYLSESGIKASSLNGALIYDPIGKLVKTGNWYSDEITDKSGLLEIFKRIESSLPSFRYFTIDGAAYHNAGASVATEIACILGHANEYMSWCHGNSLSFDKWAGRFQVEIAIGKNYFVEIAKIRALRLVWQHLLSGHNKEIVDSQLFVSAENSLRHQSNIESQLNILRATTAAMSAISAGSDALYLHPYDENKTADSQLSGRIALNIQHLLKEESHMEKVLDAGSGSYLIENLTRNIAEKARNEFLKIENSGGFLESLKSGRILNQIRLENEKEVEAVKLNENTILGVNKHRLEGEMLQEDTLKPQNTPSDQMVIEPLPFVRLSGTVE